MLLVAVDVVHVAVVFAVAVAAVAAAVVDVVVAVVVVVGVAELSHHLLHPTSWPHTSLRTLFGSYQQRSAIPARRCSAAEKGD